MCVIARVCENVFYFMFIDLWFNVICLFLIFIFIFFFIQLFLGSSTPRETIEFAAGMRMSSRKDEDDRKQMVKKKTHARVCI